jgi:putative RNA 2'-phosphotransferase
MDPVRVSKFLARILRHDPASAGIVLDANGWAPVADILAAIRRRFGPFDATSLEELVRDSDKQRYSLSADRLRIRANQGHSLVVDLGLEPRLPPALLYHGTKAHLLPLIERDGLVSGRRTHVHLSTDRETAAKVGNRRSGQAIVLIVQSGMMHDHLFFRSVNGVWLTDHVPARYLRPEQPGLSASQHSQA